MTFTIPSSGIFPVIVSAQGKQIAEWTIKVPGPESAAPAPVPPAVEEKKSTSSSSSSSEEQGPVQLGPVSATASKVTPKLLTLAQYEHAEFTVELFDDAQNKLPQSRVVVCFSAFPNLV